MVTIAVSVASAPAGFSTRLLVSTTPLNTASKGDCDPDDAAADKAHALGSLGLLGLGQVLPVFVIGHQERVAGQIKPSLNI